jgi:hypothetical protein
MYTREPGNFATVEAIGHFVAIFSLQTSGFSALRGEAPAYQTYSSIINMRELLTPVDISRSGCNIEPQA